MAEAYKINYVNRDCLSYLASPKTIRDLLLPAETTVHKKWLPAETVRVIQLPADTLGRKLNHTDSLCRKLFIKYNSLRRKQEIADSLAEAKYDGQSLQEAKITCWERTVHVSRCPALYSGRIFVPLCRELIIFVLK